MTDTRFSLDQLSPEELMAVLEQLEQDEAKPVQNTMSVPGMIPADTDRREFPLSLAQRRLWVMSQMDAVTTTAYVIAGGLRLSGNLHMQALTRSLDRIVARHAALRTHIEMRDGHPVQVIAPPDHGFPLDEINQIQETSEVMPFEPTFDLASGPLVQGQLIHLSDQEHILKIAMHHVISDGWSMGIFIRELSMLYTAFIEGSPDPLPALPIQFGDYACWQQAYLQGEVLEKQQQFWVDHLQDAPEYLILPTDHPRPEQRDYVGDNVAVVLDTELTAGLKALSQRHGCTLYMTLLAGWAALMSRLSGQEDVVIGSPIAGRTRKEAEGLIGMFVNTQALRIHLSDNPDTQALLAQVKATTLAAQSHQDIPFEEVVKAVAPTRSLSCSPVFQVVFALQNLPQGEMALSGMNLSHIDIPDHSAKFDLALIINEGQDNIAGNLNYATALFDNETITRYAGYWIKLLQGMVADSHQPLQSIPILSDKERSYLLDGLNQTQMDFPEHACVHELFEHMVAATPQAVALVTDCESLTYDGLNRRANQLAHWLIEDGVRPDSRVAVAIPRSADLLIAMLAVMKAGGAYVPLDPNYPDGRLHHMLTDSAPEVLLTCADVRPRLGEMNEQCTETDIFRDRHLWADYPQTNPDKFELQLTSRHLAYIIYTSGSTGKPKGVMVPHQGVCNVSAAQHRMFSVGPGSRVLQYASISFDASMFEIVMGLCSGAELHFVGPGQPLGESLFDVLQSRRITHASLPPAAISSLRTDVDLPDLTFLLTAGEAIIRSVIEPWIKPGRDVYNGYGPTETTIWGTTCLLNQPFTGQPPIGLPRPNGKIYILDPAGEPVPLGVTGEIWISGIGIARGYLNRPDLTEERFVPDPFFIGEPFSDASGQHMYRTGDLGYWGADGLIHYQGRCDHQVKIRGYRIELGEIETVLQRCDGIQDAVVVAQTRTTGNQQLVAYYTCTPGVTVTLRSLKVSLGETLPDYMVPSAYVMLEQLPLTANGKVDRKALPEADESAFLRQAYEAPQGETEQLLARLWCELLGISRAGRQDHFFELGGHSLLAVQLIEKLRQHGWHLDAQSLFNHPTIAALATVVSSRQADNIQIPDNLIPEGCTDITPDMLPLTTLTQAEIDCIAATVPGGVANIQDIYPLAPLQEGILFHHLLQPEGDPYVTPAILGFDNKARLDDFLTAMRAVIQRHDILRTAVVWDGLREAQQVVWRDAPLPVAELSADALLYEDVDAMDITDALQRRFAPSRMRVDIARAPMISAWQVAEPLTGRYFLCFLMHHLSMDHTTLELVLAEIQAYLTDQEQSLPPPVPFRNFVAQASQEMDRDTYIRYFSEQLSDIDTPCAPFNLFNAHSDGQLIESQRCPLDDGLALRLREQARQQGVSAASLFHLAWGIVVRTATGRDDVVFGTVLFGRMAGGEGADRALGMFLNTLPLRLSLGAITVSVALQETHTRLAELLNYEHAPLSLVQQCSGVAPQAPLFTSLLNYRYQGAHTPVQAGETELTESVWQGIDMLSGEERTNYPMGLSVDDFAGQGFCLDLKIDAEIGCERVAAMVTQALEALVSALEQPVSAVTINQLNILPQSERFRVLSGFNQTQAPFPEHQCIHQLFEQTVMVQPHATAVVCGEHTLTYDALNQQANQLARWLVKQGVCPDSRVAVSLERSCDLVVALMAILKAGGAYVPLDPGYPQDRLASMLADSQPVVVLTTAQLQSRLGDIPENTTVVDLSAERLWTDEATHDLNRTGLTNRHLAYIIYTSGSTGNPKGVMNEHQGVVNRLSWMKDDYGFGPADVVLQKTPFSFDVSVWEFFCTLWSGATLVMAKPEGHKDPQYLKTLIEQQQVTILHFVPPMLQTFLEVIEPGACASLRLVFCSGEALPAAAVRKTAQRLPGVALHNLYGPTEAAVDVTAWSCPHHLEGDSVSIGAPVANTRMYVLDGQKQPVPVGVSGELYIGGVQVARGYLNRPELTAEKFVTDPFVATADARMYRTGDVGRWLPDGTIDYQGRNDDQVKIRGFRVELGEISSALQDCHGVQEGVVIARGKGAEKQLVGYYTAADPSEPVAPETLRAELAERLPEYMVPAAYMMLEQLPLTPNGKVNRKALPEPDESTLIRHEYEAPQGETEQTLAAIWQQLLGVEQVGRHDNFFELGGHSLLAIRLISEVQKHGLQLDLAALFAAPVLQALAATISAASDAPVEADTVIPFRATGTQTPLFIVPEFSGELLYGPALTAVIDADIPIYGLSAPDRMQPALKTYQKMAARYVQMIRRTQPQGPYRLLGWSAGGVVAYEIAAQLLGQDQDIEFIGMLDSWKPGLIEKPVMSESEIMRDLSCKMVTFMMQHHGQEPQSVVLPEPKDWQDFYHLGQSAGCLPSHWSETYFHNMLLHQQAFLSVEYEALPLPVNIDLIAAQDNPSATGEPYLGWDQVLETRQIQVQRVPGEHFDLVTAPYLPRVGQAISEAIARRSFSVSQRQPAKPYEPVVTLQAGTVDQPLCICIPGAGDSVFTFVELVQAMPDNQVILALQPRGLWGEGVPHSSVEAAAAFYLQALKPKLTRSEIHVLGHSFGGWVAMELVKQMEALDIPVSSLTIADSRAPVAARQHEFTNMEAMMWLIELFEMRGQSMGLTEAMLMPLSPQSRLELVHRNLMASGLMPQRTTLEEITAIYRSFSASIRTRYLPDALPQTPTSLVVARGGSDRKLEEWRQFAPLLNVCFSPGNHVTLLRAPDVNLLVDIILGQTAI